MDNYDLREQATWLIEHDQLKHFRTTHGLSQFHAAYNCGVGLSTWNRWEHGTHHPKTAQTARKLVEYIGENQN